VLSVACKLLGAESFPPMDAFETPARSLGAAQHVSTEEMQLGPFALLPGTKELEALTKNELLVLKHRNNPAIDAASGTGVMVQVRLPAHVACMCAGCVYLHPLHLACMHTPTPLDLLRRSLQLCITPSA
jgi:hypothetical protein